jgi:hypothetical protein
VHNARPFIGRGSPLPKPEHNKFCFTRYLRRPTNGGMERTCRYPTQIGRQHSPVEFHMGKDDDAMNENIPIKRFAGTCFIILGVIVQLVIGAEFIMIALGTSQETGTNWVVMFWRGLDRTFAAPAAYLWLPLIAGWTCLCAFGTRRFVVREGNSPGWWFVLWLFLGGLIGFIFLVLYTAGFQLRGPVGIRPRNWNRSR